MKIKSYNNIDFKDDVQLYDIDDTKSLYTRIISVSDEGKTAIYIHGGGSGGNHTMLLRPSKWMIKKGLFTKIILPDRRGEGLSTPLNQKLSIREHAIDMKALLDKLNINEKITAIGISYGGPIAIELANLDSRVDEIILMASSPSLKSVKGIQGFLYRTGLLEKILKVFYKKNLGKLDSKYPNFDEIYDFKSSGQLKKYFIKAINHTDVNMLDSLMYQNASTLDPENSTISPDIKLDIPVYQIIGSKDEIWEKDIFKYKDRFTDLKQFIVEGEGHKGVLLKAGLFYEALYSIYKGKNCNSKGGMRSI